jgi:hypothetical protein
MLDTASLSTDGKPILSVRTDGQLVLWEINGTRLQESTLKHFPLGSSDRLVAFAQDGTVYTFSRTTTDRRQELSRGGRECGVSMPDDRDRPRW